MKYPTNPESIITTDDELARLRQQELEEAYDLAAEIIGSDYRNVGVVRVALDFRAKKIKELEAVLVHCNTHGLVPPLSTEHQSNALSEYRRTVQAEAVRWAADHFASPRNGHVMMISDQEQIRKLATAIERGEVEI